MKIYDYAIIGGGIIGLSTAMHLSKKSPKSRIILLEKELAPGMHQTERNSGVIHSGIYYKPKSLKAYFSKSGSQSMVNFCREHQIPYNICGKIIIATKKDELVLLDNIYDRGIKNKVPVKKIEAERVNEIEPHVKALAGIFVKSTGITNYLTVCKKYLELTKVYGGEVKLGTKVIKILDYKNMNLIITNMNDYIAKTVINCAGLHSDRVAKMAKSDPGIKIIPFRGEYYELVPEKRYLVNSLIYPVPNPKFPFLGVHFTKMIDGSVHAGPNAVIAFKREGYSKTDFSFKDFQEILFYGGFWKLANDNLVEGLKEIYRSFFKSAFVRNLQQIIPSIDSKDLIPCKAGVRAQALIGNGKMVDDFLIIKGDKSIHVCNAPSPAATASLEIGMVIANQASKFQNR